MLKAYLGKWTAINALDLAVPVTLIGEAVFARCLSALKVLFPSWVIHIYSPKQDERVAASKVLPGPAIADAQKSFKGDKKQFVECIKLRTGVNLVTKSLYWRLIYIRQALFASKLISYAQGYTMMRAAAAEYKWNLNYGGIALMWRGGCIIRSTFLGSIIFVLLFRYFIIPDQS